MIWLLACAPWGARDLEALHAEQEALRTEQEALRAEVQALQAEQAREALLAEAERHVAWVERTELSALGLDFEHEGVVYGLTTWQAGPRGTVKARVTRRSSEASLEVTQWMERGVPCYAEFTETVGDTRRGARIWLSDRDEVLRVEGFHVTDGSGELPRVDPGPLPRWSTQLLGHTLKELGALCEQTDADCVFSAVEPQLLAP